MLDITDLLKKYNIDIIIHFGNKNHNSNDIDLLIVSDDFINMVYEKRISSCKKFIRSNKKLDIFCFTLNQYNKYKGDNSPFINKIILEGKVIYDKNR